MTGYLRATERPDPETIKPGKPSPKAISALMSEFAWRNAAPDVLAEALLHVDDAMWQVIRAESKDARAAMLGKLPPHIRAIVQDRLKALWTGDGLGFVVYATDNSDDGHHDACVFLERAELQDDALRRLPRENAIWIVAKQTPP